MKLTYRIWETCLNKISQCFKGYKWSCLIFINSGPRLKGVIFPSCFAFSLNPLMFYNFKTVLGIMDQKYIFSNTQKLLLENKMLTNTHLIHKEESENIKLHYKTSGEYCLRKKKKNLKGQKTMNKIKMFLMLPQRNMKSKFFRLSLLSSSE